MNPLLPGLFLVLLAGYLLLGLLFAVPFVIWGVNQIDPHAAQGSKGFRILIIPGVIALWPLLFRRWAGGMREPPAESNAHRKLAATK
ncbi:MAG TPA: hypothetical protein VL527_02905 [Dongiaceae bacterium]|nr:hypothetical protein [Dongiaceae bacterium]